MEGKVINDEPSPVKRLKVKKSQETSLTKEEAKQLPAITKVPMSEEIAYPFFPILFITKVANGDKRPVKEPVVTAIQSVNHIKCKIILHS